MLTDGQIIPVTALLDQDGLDTDDPHEAWTYTAGPDKDGKFHADELTGYNLKKNQIN
jgi:LDH2 family malate/lactate/ureidoglycolate dehydrogenase